MNDVNKELAPQTKRLTVVDKAALSLALTAGMAMPALAADPLDVSTGVEYLGLALAAIGALGAAKLAPSAIMWVWGMVTSGARRG